MIILDQGDFKDPAWVEKLASAANLSAEEFVSKFGHLQ
jgi:hypothetical protein